MDHINELADSPDLIEALELIAPREGGFAALSGPATPDWGPFAAALPPARLNDIAARAATLRLYTFLAVEHPAGWRGEVIRTLHWVPELAAVIWWHLRYCRTFRTALAEQVLMRSAHPTPSLPEALRASDSAVAAYRRDATDGVVDYAEELRSRSAVTALIGSGLFEPRRPSIPKLIERLLAEDAVRDDKLDVEVQRYLGEPGVLEQEVRKRGWAVPFTFVQAAELGQIGAARRLRKVTAPAADQHDSSIRRALSMDLLGLAFSGGGIRSATFNLGVLQSLARTGLLRRVDYLSTVSGGGYIGSWFAAWLRREADAVADSAAAHAGAQSGPDPAVLALQRALSPLRSPNPMDARVRPIRFLREYSNYLTPKTGFLSADTWTMLGIFIRNALLNQVIIVSLLAAALLGPRIAFGILRGGRPAPAEWLDVCGWPVGVWLVPLALWGLGATVLVANLRRLRVPGVSADDAANAGPGDASSAVQARSRSARLRQWAMTAQGIHLGVILPWTLAAVGAVGNVIDHPSPTDLPPWFGGAVAVTLCLILWGGRVSRCWPRDGWERLLVPPGAAVVAGLVGWGMAHVVVVVVQTLAALEPGQQPFALAWHAVALGPPGLLSAFSVAIVAMLGILGQRFPDEHREWWSKLRTFVHVWALAWLAGFIAAVYVPKIAEWLEYERVSGTWTWPAVLGWLVSTWFGVQRGSSAEDDEKVQRETVGAPSMSARALSLAEQAAPYVFVLGLVVLVSLGLDSALPAVTGKLFHAPIVGQHFWEPAARQLEWSRGGQWPLGQVCAVFGLLTTVGLLFSWRVDINDFSLHHFYKNRLVRCYLGASRSRERMADWFTGFDPDDDVPLRAFDHDTPETTPYPGPYPIVNCALNLVGGKDLAWQERRSASFVFTPKYCGYDVDRAVLTKSTDGVFDDAFVPTRHFYQPGSGPLLGMAMAISGAAANPNMGRASTPALAFLLTVFNVRLGWWVGNPRSAPPPKLSSPWLGLPYTALELFGAADDAKSYVNLSDGGHFENLGVYELLRRGCRYIILSDAGQDGKFLGEDLGTLIRQARTDFGIEIDIDIERIRDRSPQGLSRTHCVVGKIHYLNIPKRNRETGVLENEEGGPVLPGSKPAHEEGYLIYLKPSMTGDEPQDLMEFFKRIPEFPHQSTSDQWFDESQFESYRKLGMHIADEAFCRYRDDDTRALPDLSVLFERLYGHWYPPSHAVTERGTEHANEYSRLMELIRSTPSFGPLDPQLFDDWPKTSPTGGGAPQGQTPTPPSAPVPPSVLPRDEFYICTAFIQLMENVYADLDLEHNHRHPHVRGWMRVFQYWAQQPAFRRTWTVCEWTYAERFRTFYNDRIAGRAIAFPRAFVAGRGCVNRARPADASVGLQSLVERGLHDAVARGASVLQLDVRRMACGSLVVCPSDSTNGSPIGTTMRAALAPPDQPPLLDACLAALRGRIQVILMLHDAGDGHREAVRDAVLASLLTRPSNWRRRDFVLVSSDPALPAVVHGTDRRVRVGVRVTDAVQLSNAVDAFASSGVDFIAPAQSLLNERVLKLATERRVPLIPWADAADVERAASLAGWLIHETVLGVVAGEGLDDLDAAVRAMRAL